MRNFIFFLLSFSSFATAAPFCLITKTNDSTYFRYLPATKLPDNTYSCYLSSARPIIASDCAASDANYTLFGKWNDATDIVAPNNGLTYQRSAACKHKDTGAYAGYNYTYTFKSGSASNSCPDAGVLHSDTETTTEDSTVIPYAQAESLQLQSCTQFSYSTRAYNGYSDCEVKINRETSEQRGTESALGVTISNRVHDIIVYTGLTLIQGNTQGGDGRDGFTTPVCGPNGTLADACPEGQIRNDQGQCVTPPPECVAPQVLNEAGTACIDPPPPLQCVSPQILNEAGTACIDPPDSGSGGDTGGTGGTGGDTGGTGGDTGGTGGTGGDTGGTGGTGSGTCDPTSPTYLSCLMSGGKSYSPGGLVLGDSTSVDAQISNAQLEYDQQIQDFKAVFSNESYGTNGGTLPCLQPIVFHGNSTPICLSDYDQQLSIIPPVIVLIAALIGAFIIFS